MLYFTFSPSFDTFTSYALWNSLCVGVSPSSARHWSRNQPHTRAVLKVWFSQSSLLSHFLKTCLFGWLDLCIASFFVSRIEIYSLNNTCWALCSSRLGSVPLAPLGFFSMTDGWQFWTVGGGLNCWLWTLGSRGGEDWISSGGSQSKTGETNLTLTQMEFLRSGVQEWGTGRRSGRHNSKITVNVFSAVFWRGLSSVWRMVILLCEKSRRSDSWKLAFWSVLLSYFVSRQLL